MEWSASKESLRKRALARSWWRTVLNCQVLKGVNLYRVTVFYRRARYLAVA